MKIETLKKSKSMPIQPIQVYAHTAFTTSTQLSCPSPNNDHSII